MIVAQVQVDQRVELGEATERLQLVPRQAQRLDVPQPRVSRLQAAQAVVAQVHMHQAVEVLQETTKQAAQRQTGPAVSMVPDGAGQTCRFSTDDSWL